jgi:hypothetical protein
MKMPFTVVGGTYLEDCDDPEWHELYGSGLRAAVALSRMNRNIKFVTCIGAGDMPTVTSICETFGIRHSIHKSSETIGFFYNHPLSIPEWSNTSTDKIELDDLTAENILYYGMIEGNISVHGKMVVYDPQNRTGFKETGSSADKLAIVLNRTESLLLANLPNNSPIDKIGKAVQSREEAQVVVIKDGVNGAFVFDSQSKFHIPVFKTPTVWPIGSGDIFSCAFAISWMIKHMSPRRSALFASQWTAQYCETRRLPLTGKPKIYPASKKGKGRSIYLAAPFFTVGERWLINDLRRILTEFGNKVFSPFHEVGFKAEGLSNKEIAQKDLEAIEKSDMLFAVLNGIDPGTIFEIGYAASLKKRVIVLAENMKENDLTMLSGSGCEITNDLSTAVYKASW